MVHTKSYGSILSESSLTFYFTGFHQPELPESRLDFSNFNISKSNLPTNVTVPIRLTNEFFDALFEPSTCPLHFPTGMHGYWVDTHHHTCTNTAQQGRIIPISYAMFFDILSLICITATTIPTPHHGYHNPSIFERFAAVILTVLQMLTPILGLLCLMYCFTSVQAPDPNQRTDYDVLPGMRK